MFKIFDPDSETASPTTPDGFERLIVPPVRKKAERKPAPIKVRCRRPGCGKKSIWPHDGPIFCTRLCGYLYAVKLFKQKRA